MTGNLNLPPIQLMVRGGSFMAQKGTKITQMKKTASISFGWLALS